MRPGYYYLSENESHCQGHIMKIQYDTNVSLSHKGMLAPICASGGCYDAFEARTR
jgi:hypothetical protein